MPSPRTELALWTGARKTGPSARRAPASPKAKRRRRWW